MAKTKTSAQGFLSDKKNLLILGVAVILLLVAGFLAYTYVLPMLGGAGLLGGEVNDTTTAQDLENVLGDIEDIGDTII